MSKQCKKVEQLPLDGPNWMPAAEAHRLLTGFLDHPYLAAKDLTAAVAAKHSDNLPCMRRLIFAPDQDRKIVPLSFHFDLVSQKLRVWEPQDDAPVFHGPVFFAPVYFDAADAAPVYFDAAETLFFDLAEAAFFVWRPKFEKIWPALAASAPARSSPAGIEAPPSRRRGPATTHDWMSICGEIAARCINPRDGRLVVPVKDSAIVASMRILFLDNNLAVPATTEMSEAVRRVCAPLREVQRKVPRKVR